MGLLYVAHALLPYMFNLLCLPCASVSLSYFNLAVSMCKCWRHHSSMSSTFSTAVLIGTCCFPELSLSMFILQLCLSKRKNYYYHIVIIITLLLPRNDNTTITNNYNNNNNNNNTCNLSFDLTSEDSILNTQWHMQLPADWEWWGTWGCPPTGGSSPSSWRTVCGASQEAAMLVPRLCQLQLNARSQEINALKPGNWCD